MQLKLSTLTKHARRVPDGRRKHKDGFSFVFFVVVFLASIVVASAAKSLGYAFAVTGCACCAIVTIVAVKLRWELKGRWWFWVAVGLGVGLQVPLILLFPWDRPFLTGTGGLALSIPGFLIVYGCIYAADKLLGNSTRPK